MANSSSNVTLPQVPSPSSRQSNDDLEFIDAAQAQQPETANLIGHAIAHMALSPGSSSARVVPNSNGQNMREIFTGDASSRPIPVSPTPTSAGSVNRQHTNSPPQLNQSTTNNRGAIGTVPLASSRDDANSRILPRSHFNNAADGRRSSTSFNNPRTDLWSKQAGVFQGANVPEEVKAIVRTGAVKWSRGIGQKNARMNTQRV